MKTLQVLLILFLLLITLSCEKAIVSRQTSGKLSTINDPEQEFMEEMDEIVINNDSGEFKITPVAEYSISARVVSARSYSRKWTSSLAPVDLALVWGKLADKNMDDFISYKQRNRWYFYRYSPDCPVDNNYIIAHSSNNHIVPSSYNLSIAIKSIRKNDLIRIEGYLIRVSGFSKKRKVNWGTSTTRTDTGDRSCELIYLKTIRINDKIYR
ncbi:MAG: hypothetical protein ABFR36_01380 [Acidobacteriota bacterium]